jgi:hypothetical protein
MAIEIFSVEWTKLQPFDSALNQSASQEGGVYAMFMQTNRGFKLYYIGMSKDFSKRFSTHRINSSHLMSKDVFNKCFVSFGIVYAFGKSRMSHDVTPDQLHYLESYFINELKSEGNDPSSKKGYKGSPILVFNSGDSTLKNLFKKEMSNSIDLIKFLKAHFS